MYRFFPLLVLAWFFLSCGNPVYTREEDSGNNGGSDSGAEGPALVSIGITRLPSKTSYEWGEELDISGLEVTGTYSDGSTRIESVNRSNVSGYSRTREGVQELRVYVQGRTVTFTVVVWDFIKIKVIDPASLIEVVLPSGSAGPTSLADWYIYIRNINGGAAPFAVVYPGVDGCYFTASGPFSAGTYEITVIFRETYSERFQIQVN
ncbi:MAG: bacterial Ig-like domain-containing protein [Treponema sp.]|nr:bacterial Ig-like domain-containing protein [Treponema sp.]